MGGMARIVITGHRKPGSQTTVSRGQVSIQTPTDPAGAPILYRDVPLMPSASEKGVLKPLAPKRFHSLPGGCAVSPTGKVAW